MAAGAGAAAGQDAAGRPITRAELPVPLTVRDTTFQWGRRTYVMAILNVTPDSFSGDGTAYDVEAAVARGVEAVDAGADILDVGGESTRPGATPVSEDEEVERTVPVVRALRGRVGVPISIDTYKAAVAAAAIDAGADMINDVWGLRADGALATLAAERRVPVVLMHNRSDPSRVARSEVVGGHYEGIAYGDVVADVTAELKASIDLARGAGIPDEHIVVDPGLGFGKTVEQNLRLIDRTDAVAALGYPVLVGPSRKSFIGAVLELPADRRVDGTAAAVAVAVTRGADVVRVHDVAPMVAVARMTDAIVRPSAEARASGSAA